MTPEALKAEITALVAEASMCWIPEPAHPLTFNANKASKIVDELLALTTRFSLTNPITPHCLRCNIPYARRETFRCHAWGKPFPRHMWSEGHKIK